MKTLAIIVAIVFFGFVAFAFAFVMFCIFAAFQDKNEPNEKVPFDYMNPIDPFNQI